MSNLDQMDRLDARAEERARRYGRPHLYFSDGGWLVGERPYRQQTPVERAWGREAWRWAFDQTPVANR